jgi:hypothetical protein
MAQRRSYFEEKRSYDPNFIRSGNCMSDVRSNIRRIIKDIYFDLISDNDYIYFTNESILSSLLTTSYENYRNNELILYALNDYLQKLSINVSFGGNVLEDRVRATNLQTKHNRLAQAWATIHQHFMYIKLGYDSPKNILKHIQNMSKEDILNM